VKDSQVQTIQLVKNRQVTDYPVGKELPGNRLSGWRRTPRYRLSSW
jgi:hypothetical protein